MSENTSSIKKSFFGEYFRYKLRTLRGLTITFAVMNFLSTVCFASGILIFVRSYVLPMYKKELSYDLGPVAIFLIFMYLMIAIMFIQIIMLVILPAVNFKIFNRRSYMDTLGGLPLTNRQRFFGDMLSGAAAFGLSFIPCSVAAAVIAAITEFGPMRELYEIMSSEQDYYRYSFPWGDENILEIALIVLLTLLLCYAATYAISCFVTSCCGKVGTSVLFSFIMILAFTMIAFTFATYIFNNATGFDTDTTNMTVLSAIPPAGTLIATIVTLTGSGMSFVVLTPLVMIILLFIVLFGIGSYFAAMRRKTERVECEIVFGAGYYVISAIITVMAGGFCLSFLKTQATYMIPMIVIALGTCIVMAHLHSRSVKKLWKGFAVFAAVGAACLVIGFVISKTHGLGISYIIPSKQSIKSIEISGDSIHLKFQNHPDFNESVTIESDNEISLVLSEHKKILDDLGNYCSEENPKSGFLLTIQYHLKNGLTATRRYAYIGEGESLDDDPAIKFTDKISELPELNFMTTLGFLGNHEMTCINIIYSGRDPNNLTKDEYGINLIVKPSERDKFIECFREDLMNSPRIPSETDSTFGILKYEYIDKSGKNKTLHHMLWFSYDKVIEFLQDPKNFAEESNITVDESKSYYVWFYHHSYPNGPLENSINFNITRPELAREFLSYLESAYAVSDDEYSECFTITNSDYNFKIKKENEQAALSALIKAIRAHRAIGGGNDQN